MRWPELARAFSQHLQGAGPAPALLQAIAARSPAAAEARLGVHARHVRVSLSTALLAHFPLIARLTGADFLRHAAECFVAQHPPRCPVVAAYGAALPDFLGQFAPARPLPWLADAARAEWAMQVARRAPLVPPLSGAALAGAGIDAATRVMLDPSLAYVASDWPIGTILQATAAEQPPAHGLPAHGETLEIRREPDGPGVQASFRILPAVHAALRRHLQAGLSLGAAAEHVLANNPDFDLTAALRALAADRIITGLLPPRTALEETCS